MALTEEQSEQKRCRQRGHYDRAPVPTEGGGTDAEFQNANTGDSRHENQTAPSQRCCDETHTLNVQKQPQRREARCENAKYRKVV